MQEEFQLPRFNPKQKGSGRVVQIRTEEKEDVLSEERQQIRATQKIRALLRPRTAALRDLGSTPVRKL